MVSTTEVLVLDYLKRNEGKRFTIKQLHREIIKNYRNFGFHYITVRRAVEKLKKCKVGIKTEEYPFVVWVWYDGKQD